MNTFFFFNNTVFLKFLTGSPLNPGGPISPGSPGGPATPWSKKKRAETLYLEIIVLTGPLLYIFNRSLFKCFEHFSSASKFEIH